MKCKLCGSIFGGHYKLCPHCHGDDMEREQFVQQPKEEQDDTKDNPLIVNGEFNFDEMNDD